MPYVIFDTRYPVPPRTSDDLAAGLYLHYRGYSILNAYRATYPEAPSDSCAFFTSRKEAHESLQTWRNYFPDRLFELEFVITESERDCWRDRERGRERDGIYLPVPWIEQVPPECKHHYCHVSLDNPGMVAYTPDDEYGVTDRQIRLRPGRYLEQFYSHVPKSQRDSWIHQCAGIKATEYAIASDPKDCASVYLSEGGPSSCMDAGHWPADDDGDGIQSKIHPAHVYGVPGDLAVAFWPCDALSNGPVKQRTIVWPERKTYSRIYGNGPLKELLARDGYTQAFPVGAKVRAIHDDGDWLMPYIDGINGGKLLENGDFIELGRGYLSVQTTWGHTGSRREDRADWVRCESCSDLYDPDDEGASSDCCASCENGRSTCDDCGERFWSDEVVYIGGSISESLCVECRSQYLVSCADPDCGETWIEDQEFTARERRVRSCDGTTGYCRDCASHTHTCGTNDAADSTRNSLIAQLPAYQQGTVRVGPYDLAADGTGVFIIVRATDTHPRHSYSAYCDCDSCARLYSAYIHYTHTGEVIVVVPGDTL